MCTASKGPSSAQKAAAEAEAGQAAGEQYALQTHRAVEGVKTASKGTLVACAAGLAVVCAYYIGKELMPDKLGPNSVFNAAFDLVRNHPELTSRLGSGIKGYGRDLGGRREGRRNFIDHIKYKDDEGFDHTRIRFNVEGPRGKGIVYADQSAAASKGEFYYLILEVPQKRGPSFKYAVQDNRPKVPLSVRQSEVADVLTNKAGARLYGSLNDKNTIAQLKEFGQAVKRIKFINCDENPQECQAAGIMRLPTWIINRRPVVGLRKLEDLDTEAKKRLK
jgi:hypothetical protein